MHVCQRAASLTCGKVLTKPLFLRQSRAAATCPCAVAVERNQVPAPNIEAVIALIPIACGARDVPDPIEIIEVARCFGRAVLMVAYGRPGDRLHTSPRGVVTSPRARPSSGQVVLIGADVILGVSQRKHGRGIHLDEQVRGLHLLTLRDTDVMVPTASDVTRCGDHRIDGGRQNGGLERPPRPEGAVVWRASDAYRVGGNSGSRVRRSAPGHHEALARLECALETGQCPLGACGSSAHLGERRSPNREQDRHHSPYGFELRGSHVLLSCRAWPNPSVT